MSTMVSQITGVLIFGQLFGTPIINTIQSEIIMDDIHMT